MTRLALAQLDQPWALYKVRRLHVHATTALALALVCSWAAAGPLPVSTCVYGRSLGSLAARTERNSQRKLWRACSRYINTPQMEF